jgi:hypothetical protein
VENSIKNIYEELNNTLNSFSFIDRYRLSKTAFIRNRTRFMLTIDYANIRAYTNIINGLTLTYWHWGLPLR